MKIKFLGLLVFIFLSSCSNWNSLENDKNIEDNNLIKHEDIWDLKNILLDSYETSDWILEENIDWDSTDELIDILFDDLMY